MKSSLELTIAKLELKQLEVIDKISKSSNDYIIRCITCPNSNEFLAVNGDWKKVVGWEEEECVGKTIFDFIAPYEVERAKLEGLKLKTLSTFDSFICDMMNKDGDTISVDWKARFYPDINSIVSIGRVKK